MSVILEDENDPIFLKYKNPIVKLAKTVYKNLFPKGKKVPNELNDLEPLLKNLIGKGDLIQGYPHIYIYQINELKEIRKNINNTPYVTPTLDKLIDQLDNINDKSGGGRRHHTTRKRLQRKRKATRRR